MDDGNTADVVYLDFAKAFDSVNHMSLLAKLESLGLCERVVRWVRSYLPGKYLQDASGRCVAAGTMDQTWGTSGVSDRATSFLVVYQWPPKCQQCNNTVFRRRFQDGLTTLKKLPFAELPLQRLEFRAIPFRSQTLLKTCAFSWTITSHLPYIAKRLPPK